MRLCLLFAATLALAACGARNDIEQGTGGGGASLPDGGGGAGGAGSGGSQPMPEQLAQMGDDCAPDDGHAVSLVIGGTSSCATWPLLSSGLRISVFDQALANLNAGGTVKIAEGFASGAQATRWTVDGQSFTALVAVSGTLFISTFVELQGATGTYDITYEDATTEQGSFSALWCEPDEPSFCG